MGRRSQGAAEIRTAQAISFGITQACALVPDVSHSGAPITFRLFLGFKREEVARFSFLLSVPATAAAAMLRLAEAAGEGTKRAEFFAPWTFYAPMDV